MSDVRGRVLVVDDQPQVLKIVAAMLTAHGYAVLTADSVSSATQLLTDNVRLRSAVLDVDLPDGVGFDLVLPLRQCQRDCHIVMMTGRLQPSVTQQASDLGVGTVLCKPFKRAQLLQALETGPPSATEIGIEPESGRRERIR